jgi:hypothetical protein
MFCKISLFSCDDLNYSKKVDRAGATMWSAVTRHRFGFYLPREKGGDKSPHSKIL